ncbi:AarF/ABC1/UbiB kinase family protein, partial [bacterium]|nr:AarF/ABC1/UbiB kinase family protein [bacterium]
FIREFSKLQDHVASLPFSELRPIVEKELGGPLEKFFLEVNETPLGSASIAQVHEATTLAGETVVIKIRKPGVQKLLRQDLEILEWLAGMAESSIDELKNFHLPMVVSELKKTLLKEADFIQEARSMKSFSENFKDSDFLVIPKVYEELSTEAVLTMEKLKGIKLSDTERLREAGFDTAVLMKNGIDCFFKSVLVFGLFHADPHGGNILVLEGNRMGLLDFGSVAWLSERSKTAIIHMFMALVAEDYEALVLEYLLLSPGTYGNRSTTKVELIYNEVSHIFGPYHGRPINEIPAGKLLLEATNVAYRYQIVLPQDLILVFKSIMTLEGIGRQLDPNFDLLGAASGVSKLVFKQQWAPEKLAKEALQLGRDFSRFTRYLPRQASEILRQVEDGEIHFHTRIHGLDQLVRAHNLSSKRLSLSFVFFSFLSAATAAHITAEFSLWIEITLWAFCGLFLLALLRYIFLPRRL